MPVYFAPSWVLVATAVTIAYSGLLRSLVDGLSTRTSYLAAFGFAVALALCVLAHELGHTAVSLALGHPVRRIVIYLLGGVSEIDTDVERPRDELLIAAAGPLASGLIAAAGGRADPVRARSQPMAGAIGLTGVEQCRSGRVQRLPGLPLDGGRVLRAAVWALTRSVRTGTVVGAWVGRVLAVVIAVGSALSLGQTWGVADVRSWDCSSRLSCGSAPAARLPRPPSGSGPRRCGSGDLLRPGVLVSPDTSLAEAMRRARESSARGIVVVDSEYRPQAIVEENRVRDVPVERQAWTPVTAVARPLEPGLVISDTLGGAALMNAVRSTPAGEYLVVGADGHPAGILAAGDLAAALGGGRR